MKKRQTWERCAIVRRLVSKEIIRQLHDTLRSRAEYYNELASASKTPSERREWYRKKFEEQATLYSRETKRVELYLLTPQRNGK